MLLKLLGILERRKQYEQRRAAERLAAELEAEERARVAAERARHQGTVHRLVRVTAVALTAGATRSLASTSHIGAPPARMEDALRHVAELVVIAQAAIDEAVTRVRQLRATAHREEVQRPCTRTPLGGDRRRGYCASEQTPIVRYRCDEVDGAGDDELVCVDRSADEPGVVLRPHP